METIQKPENWPLTLYRGDRFPNEEFRVFDNTSPNPVQFTVFDVKAQFKKKNTDVAYVKQLTVGSGLIKLDNGNVKFDTNVDMEPGNYYWDLQVILSNGHVYTIASGKVAVFSDTTR